MKGVFKIAVISDLHCRHGGGKSVEELNTYLPSDILGIPVNKNPVEALKKLIIDNSLSANIVLCPGDICDKMDLSGLTRGWEFLGQISAALGTNQLVATVGNHDMDSHNEIEGRDPASHNVQSLSAIYPTFENGKNIEYWGKNFCIIESEQYLLLNVNSSFSHTDKKMAKFSRITSAMLEAISDDLSKKEHDGKRKIALVHHHPMHHSNMSYRDSDFIDKSDEFISLLEKFGFDICIHGHKHDPRLEYRNSMTVFGAGTFSSTMNLLDLKADNTFHIISLVEKRKYGIIESWIYSPKNGWKQKKDTYFPCYTGFGLRPNMEDYAQMISDWYDTQNKEIVSFENVLVSFPDIVFLIPEEQIMLDELLGRKFQKVFIPELFNRPVSIQKLY